METVRLTEFAALYASRHMGRGNEDLAYLSAEGAMLKGFNSIQASMRIAIGSDVQGSALPDGATIGTDTETKIDVAVKALDGKMTCARGGHNAASVVAVDTPGAFMPTSPGLMMKLAVGPEGRGMIDIDLPPAINIKRIARAKNKYIEDITVCVLDRDYNHSFVSQIRETGARIVFIRDGDISGAISAAMPNNQIDLLIGIGGRKEGVLAAAAIKCLGGDMQARYISREEDNDSSDVDYNKIYSISDLVKGNETVVAITGVTDGVLLKGVRYISGGAETSSLVLRQKTHTIREIKAHHQFDFKPGF
jgi:fructose-1,6-bisphosphatase II